MHIGTDDTGLILESLDYSKERIRASQDTPYEIRRDKLAELDEPSERLRASSQCRCCVAGLPFEDQRVCPECGHAFQGNGWDGIDAHWRAHHGDIQAYEEFWSNLCRRHR